MAKIVTINSENSEVLRAQAKPLSKDEILSKETEKIKKEMKEELSKEKFGVAIAAPQIGYSIALFLISGDTIAHAKNEDFDPQKHKDLYAFNPKIIRHSKKQILSDEGCLSVPFKYSYSVPRYEKVTVEYLDENGKRQILNASGFLSRVFQHEIDHLHGILYIDKAKEIIDVDEEMRPITPSN